MMSNRERMSARHYLCLAGFQKELGRERQHHLFIYTEGFVPQSLRQHQIACAPTLANLVPERFSISGSARQ